MYIYLSMDINENIDKLNMNSKYFHDICYISTSDSGTDITLKDRGDEYIKKIKHFVKKIVILIIIIMIQKK